ncbi:unnamed protein product [Schistosoma turkestanicum]|nr:unnamed protein product [Schistosoma turkestanicum]
MNLYTLQILTKSTENIKKMIINQIMQNFSLKSFIYTTILLNIYMIKSIAMNEPNVFYVNDDTNEGQRIGRITHLNGNNQPMNLLKTGHLKAVIVRGNRPPAVYFRLNENTGDLYTRTVIDREALCFKQHSIDGPLNNHLSKDFNVQLTDETHYQYALSSSSLSSSAAAGNSKIVHQCKFTFQVALHRTFSQQQQQTHHQPHEPAYPYLPEFIDITIFVIDRNDHIPTFQPHSVINLSIPESVPIGTRVQLPLAYDPDSPEFSVQRYELYPVTMNGFALYTQTTDIIQNTNLLHEITGLYLEVKTMLDRELQESYTLEIKAFDSLVTSTTTTTTTSLLHDNRNVLKIYLTIEDINDNGPIFQPPQTNLTNNPTMMMMSSIMPSSTLPFSSTALSSNIFTYKIELTESSWPKTPILQLITKDLDSSKYALTKYEFASHTEHRIKQLFKLNEHTGELFLKQPLDYEKYTSYTFDVLAIDSEYDRRSKLDSQNVHFINSRLPQPQPHQQQHNIYTSTANVLVNVLDINDEIPIIELDYLRIDETTGRPATYARIEENSEPPQFIADILVTDRDANAANSHVICTIVNKLNRPQNNNNNNHNNNDNNNSNNKTDLINTLFQLTEVKRQPGLVQYNMLTVRSLDRETNGAIIRVRVQCSDSGEIKKFSEVDLVIHVIDLNDNSPQIHLITQNLNTIKSETNNIIYLKENSQTGTIVGQFNVTDQDSGENSRTTCTLTSVNNDPLLLNIHEYFQMDPTSCNLITRKPIDRESTYPPLDEINLTIEVNDHGQPMHKSNLNIKVKILNENDNVPVFQHTFYRFSIKENLPAGVSVGQLMITDLDGDYDRLDVRLQKQEQLPFQLWKSETTTSTSFTDHSNDIPMIVYYLNTTKLLDREEKSSYEFEIYANDVMPDNEELLFSQQKLSMKSFSHRTSTSVLVTVEDENDNDPVIIFPQQPDKIFILSNLEKKYYQLMTVNANDKDPTSNTFIFMLEQKETVGNTNATTLKTTHLDEIDINESKSALELIQKPYSTTNQLNTFLEIDRSVGTVYLSRDIQQNDTGTHVFHVIVQDSILNPRTASLRFFVKVEPIPPRSYQIKSNNNNLLNNEHNERRVLLSENTIHSEYFDSNFDRNTHYSKLSNNRENFLSNRKLDNTKLIIENHSYPLLSSSSSSSSIAFSSTKQFNRRLTSDTVLILSLGLILLILLATLCLVIFARHWSVNSAGIPQNLISPDKIQCSNLFCCCITPNHKQVPNNDHLKADKKEVINIFQPTHSSPHINNHHSPINLNCDNTVRSLDTFNASLSDSYSQKILDNEHVYYRDCRQFSLLPVLTSTINSESGSFPTDYTALQTITSCKCCTPPPQQYTYNIDNSNQHLLESFMIQPMKHNNTLQTNPISNCPISYYTTLSPKLKSDNVIDKQRKVRIMSTMKENVDVETSKNSPSEYLTT